MLPEQAVQAVQPRGWQRRFTIVGLCFVAFMLCNMDRVNMSIAILPMSKQYGWDSATIGLVQSSFFWWAMAWAGLGSCICCAWRSRCFGMVSTGHTGYL